MMPKPGTWAKQMHECMGPQLGMLMWDAKNVGQETASGDTVLASAGIGEVLGAADPRMAAESYMTAHLSAAWALGVKLVPGMRDSLGGPVLEPEAEPTDSGDVKGLPSAKHKERNA